MSKVTLMDIATKANVSKTTVSMVLNNKPNNISEKTKNKIFEIAKELEYVPNSLARGLSTKKSYTIGVLVPDIQNPFFNQMIKVIEKILEEKGYSIIICNNYSNKERERNNIRLLLSKIVDGVIIAAVDDSDENFSMLEKNKVPFVIVDRIVDNDEKYNSVFCDNKLGINMGMDYLYSKGKRKIGFVSGNKDMAVANIRLQSYIEKSIELGVYDKDFNIQDEFTMEGGFNATKSLLAKNKKIDSIFYSSDIMAIGGIKYLLRSGYKIPEDISILGFDNINIGSFIEPELTTIAQPIDDIAKEAANMLIALMDDKSLERSSKVKKPFLVERATVK